MSYWWEHEIKPSMQRSPAMKGIIDRVASGGCSSHSPLGMTMLLVLAELEQRSVPYRIDAVPGEGYLITGQPKIVDPVILRRAAVEAMVGLSSSALYKLMAAGEFPLPIESNRAGAAGWRIKDIEAWIAAHPATAAEGVDV